MPVARNATKVCRPEHSVAVANDISRRGVPWDGVGYLSRDPLGGWSASAGHIVTRIAFSVETG